MYDSSLGGHHDFAIDRQAAAQAIALYPDLPLRMRANRASLRHTVAFAARMGIDRFLARR